MNYPPQPPHAPQQPTNDGASTAIIIIGVLFGLVAVIGILAVLGIYGVRKYIAGAKTAEAKNSLGMIAKEAAMAYERDGKVCPSASMAIPPDVRMVSGRKYMSAPDEWRVDEAKNAGFACLKFEISWPQYYQYDYKATPTGFVATARGDLDGDGELSTFEIRGEVQDGQLRVSPNVLEENPQE
jgi:type IV pilus assembly protein PilA